MTRSTLRLTALPLFGLALAACGSPAINTNYTPGATPSSAVAASSQPSKPASTKPAKTKASAHPSAGVTHSSAPAKPSAPHASTPASHPTSPGGTHTVKPTGATITVTPSTGLSDGQTVTIHGTHFNPKIQVIAVECVDLGSSTQSNNCNINILSLPKGFYPAADGTFTTTLKVQKSFGSNTCSSSTPCLVSVTEPNNNPTEEADAPIRFR